MDTTGFNMEACLERARQGDNSAVRELLHALYPLMLKLVRAHLPRRTSEEDLCQMIAIKIVSNLGQYRGSVPIEHWVSRIAINTCLNAVKAEKSRPELRWADLSEDQVNLLNALTATSDDVQPAAARELVDRLLLELNPQDRLVISLLHLEGRTIDLAPRQGLMVPRGVEHRTRAPSRTVVLMIEAASVTPTGD